jgi:hypothetical protein
MSGRSFHASDWLNSLPANPRATGLTLVRNVVVIVIYPAINRSVVARSEALMEIRALFASLGGLLDSRPSTTITLYKMMNRQKLKTGKNAERCTALMRTHKFCRSGSAKLSNHFRSYPAMESPAIPTISTRQTEASWRKCRRPSRPASSSAARKSFQSMVARSRGNSRNNEPGLSWVNKDASLKTK